MILLLCQIAYHLTSYHDRLGMHHSQCHPQQYALLDGALMGSGLDSSSDQP